MAHELTGRVWILPDDIETGQILPYTVFGEIDPEQARSELFADVAPGLASRMRAGDMLWAGEGFGQGSSREDAPRLLKAVGIRLVMAQSFARIFYRNAINIGLPVAVGDCGDTRSGDELQVNLVTGEVVNLSRHQRLRVAPVPREVRPLLAEGGLVEYVKKYGSLSSES